MEFEPVYAGSSPGRGKEFSTDVRTLGTRKIVEAICWFEALPALPVNSPECNLFGQRSQKISCSDSGVIRAEVLTSVECFRSTSPNSCSPPGRRRNSGGPSGGRTSLPPKWNTLRSRNVPFQDGCPYYSARNRAMGDATAVTTFHYFEYGVLNGIKKMEKKAEWHPPSSPELEWKKIDVLIIDEAHNLPDSLVDFFTVKASSKWPRFDFSNFMTSIDRAKDAHPKSGYGNANQS